MSKDDDTSSDEAAGGEAISENLKIVDFEAWKRRRQTRRLLQQLREFELLDQAPDEPRDPQGRAGDRQ